MLMDHSQLSFSTSPYQGLYDLSQVNLLVLSHGHYDHSGGILPFTGRNSKAKIFMHQSGGIRYPEGDSGGTAEVYAQRKKIIC